MKQKLMYWFVLSGMLPFSLLAQNPNADPVTGNAPIAFYGRVVDHVGKPIAGVEVIIDIRGATPDAATRIKMGQEKSTLHSDANGDFMLTGASGYSIKIESIRKDGYKLSDKFTREYTYSWSGDIFHPDPTNPVVFKMWKKRGAEKLVHSAWRTRSLVMAQQIVLLCFVEAQVLTESLKSSARER